MRVYFIPESPDVYIFAAVFLVVAVACVTLYRRIFPPAALKLLADPRYQEALSIYTNHLRIEGPTRADRRAALAAASDHLVDERGVPAEEARLNLQSAVAGHDRERSYDMRHEALACEEAGEHEMALDYFERAAMWQEDHDPEDIQFLERCMTRVRGKIRPR
jgi:hypothetical protein